MTIPPPALARRAILAGLPALLAAGCAQAAPTQISVYKTPWCGCCSGWVTHLVRAGFQPEVVEVQDLTQVRERRGVPSRLASCHTAVAGGYVVEGHVPPADVQRLLQEKPNALGLVVPGMPVGSPGMETPQGDREPYETLLLLDRAGRTVVFARHGRRRRVRRRSHPGGCRPWKDSALDPPIMGRSI